MTECGCINPNLCNHGRPELMGVDGEELRELREKPKNETLLAAPPDEPDEKKALAALKRYRSHPTDEDSRRVHAWLEAAKDDPDEYARRVRLTAPK